MTEVIDELAYEASCNEYSFWDPNHPETAGWIINRDKLDKFAELIIKECIKISNESGSSTIIADRISEHFGVK